MRTGWPYLGSPSDGGVRGVSGTILFGVLVSDVAGSGPLNRYTLFLAYLTEVTESYVRYLHSM